MGKDYNDTNDKNQRAHGVMEGAPAYQTESFLCLVPEKEGKLPDDYPMVSEAENKILDDHMAVWEMGDKAIEDKAIEDYPVNTETGNRTIEDYLALPDDRRVELIDGVFYDMASPTYLHQSIMLQVWKCLDDFVKGNRGSCIPFAAPADVQLFNDDKTMVQPDVFVVCDRDKLTKKRMYGAPDLIVEVASPSSWKLDAHLKLIKYRQAGVREYWIVIPDAKKVLVYLWENTEIAKDTEDDTPVEYTFSDKVPVGIWSGRCEVDFAEIYKQCRFLYEL